VSDLLGLLAEPDRLRVVAALVLGARTTAEVVAATGLAEPACVKALNRLRRGGLVGLRARAWVVHEEVFTQAARAAAPPSAVPSAADLGALDERSAAVLRAFLRPDGRLERIPAARGKRRVVLDHLASGFEPGMRYPEREVDATLRAFHPDHAALRRYLVDEGFLERAGGIYWRTGGTVEL